MEIRAWLSLVLSCAIPIMVYAGTDVSTESSMCWYPWVGRCLTASTTVLHCWLSLLQNRDLGPGFGYPSTAQSGRIAFLGSLLVGMRSRRVYCLQIGSSCPAFRTMPQVGWGCLNRHCWVPSCQVRRVWYLGFVWNRLIEHLEACLTDVDKWCGVVLVPFEDGISHLHCCWCCEEWRLDWQGPWTRLVPEVRRHLDPLQGQTICGSGFAGIHVASVLVWCVGVMRGVCRSLGEELRKFFFQESLCLIKCDDHVHTCVCDDWLKIRTVSCSNNVERNVRQRLF